MIVVDELRRERNAARALFASIEGADPVERLADTLIERDEARRRVRELAERERQHEAALSAVVIEAERLHGAAEQLRARAEELRGGLR